MQLGPGAVAAGYRLVHLADIDSTNSEAFRRAAAGERGPLWIVADRQSAGRGRRGRHWQSLGGNLHSTLLLTGLDAAAVAPLALLAGVAVAEAIEGLAPRLAPGPRLKWPNDLLVRGAKLSGVLIEAEPGGAGRFAVALGCGVNCRTRPPDLPYAATTLADLGVEAGPAEVLAPLADAVARRLAALDAPDGFQRLRDDWLGRAVGLGASVRVRLPGGVLDGVFETLDHDGRLVLRLPGGARRVVSSGEVFFGSASPLAALAR
jgi:BirA family biotin operon repressor/biotin-[acetyl-CoA-carboxylase] ligase